jgi:hypothetical protein
MHRHHLKVASSPQISTKATHYPQTNQHQQHGKQGTPPTSSDATTLVPAEG